MYEPPQSQPRISDDMPFITRTLIDTEAFASFMKEMCEKNENIISQFTGEISRNPIASRIPTCMETPGPGMDAAIAATLGFIPLDYTKNIMKLHNGNYTPELISEMREHIDAITSANAPTPEIDAMHTFWWLAMSSVCIEGNTSPNDFYNQYHDVNLISSDIQKRFNAAKYTLITLHSAYTMDNKTNLPYGSTDGCLHAGYLAGYDVATMYASEYNLYFLGTFIPGKFQNIIENHKFATDRDEQGRTTSGVINQTFLKFATYEEMVTASNLL